MFLDNRETQSSHLLTVQHLDILDDAAVFLQDRDSLGKRHPWKKKKNKQTLGVVVNVVFVCLQSDDCQPPT